MHNTRRFPVAVMLSLTLACGGSSGTGGGGGTCADLAGTWVGTESVTVATGACPASTGLSTTYSITQAAGSCSFSLQNSHVSGVVFSGTASSSHLVSWTSPPYPFAGGTLTLDSVTGTLSTDQETLAGHFTWSWAGGSVHCTGTTTFDVARQPANDAVALTVPVTGSGGFNYTQGSYLEGFQFTANRAIAITQLGAYDSNLSSLPGGAETFAPAVVGVYDLTTHALLGSVTVHASDPATGVFRYAALPTPVTLDTTASYAVVWVSGTNHYIASPTLLASDVSSAINYLAFAGHGPGGLTTTDTLVEPSWFYSMQANGLSALNYDLGPNFIFTN